MYSRWFRHSMSVSMRSASHPNARSPRRTCPGASPAVIAASSATRFRATVPRSVARAARQHVDIVAVGERVLQRHPDDLNLVELRVCEFQLGHRLDGAAGVVELEPVASHACAGAGVGHRATVRIGQADGIDPDT